MPLYIVLVVINFKQKFMTNFNCINDGKFVKSKNASSYRSRGLPPLSSQSRCYLDHYPLTPHKNKSPQIRSTTINIDFCKVVQSQDPF